MDETHMKLQTGRHRWLTVSCLLAVLLPALLRPARASAAVDHILINAVKTGDAGIFVDGQLISENGRFVFDDWPKP